MQRKKLFGSSGIRGEAESFLTNQFCFDIGRTFANFLKSHGTSVGVVCIGMDPRESSPRIKKAVGSGILYENIEVVDEGVVPIPAMNSILNADENYIGSIMVTGSHIKAHLNGIKFFAFGEEILKKHEQEIENIYETLEKKINYQDLSDKFGIEERAKNTYIEYLLNFSKNNYPKWKIVVDPGNGAQTEVLPFVLEKLGLDIIKINSSLQQEFLSRDTEVMDDFKILQEEVLKNNADFGIGFDSDGDRAIFVDEKGNFIPGDYSATLIAREKGFNKIVTPIGTSQVVEKVIKNVYRTKVGSPYVVERMKKEDADMGFEANGGCIFNEMHSRDGGRTTIEFLNILSNQNSSLSEFISSLPKFYIGRDKIDYKLEDYEKIIEKAKSNFKPIKIDETDGLKMWIDETSWILFRSSQNAPEFRVFVESESDTKTIELLKNGLDLVKSVVKNA